MSTMVFRCPCCTQPFQVLAEQAGQMVRCPACTEPVQIPASDPAPVAAPFDLSRSSGGPAEEPITDFSLRGSRSRSKIRIGPPPEEVDVPAQAPAEQAEPYDCPTCSKAFGIYPSMYGSEMLCPHCQDTVVLRRPVEEAVPCSCPQCKQAFGVYPSMFGSQMLCPHCQAMVMLSPPTKQPDPKPVTKKKAVVKVRPKKSSAAPKESEKPVSDVTPKVAKTGKVSQKSKTTLAKDAEVTEGANAAKDSGAAKKARSPQKTEAAKTKETGSKKGPSKPVSPEPSSSKPASPKSVAPVPVDAVAAAPITHPVSPQPVEAHVSEAGKGSSTDNWAKATVAPQSPANTNPAAVTTSPTGATTSPAAAVTSTVMPQSVDHLLPPMFQAVDPAFFYRRHQDGAQVLLPSEDGSVKVVDNRIITIEHNGKTYELVSSPEYDRIQKAIVNNVLAVVVCGLLIAIVMTLLR